MVNFCWRVWREEEELNERDNKKRLLSTSTTLCCTRIGQPAAQRRGTMTASIQNPPTLTTLTQSLIVENADLFCGPHVGEFKTLQSLRKSFEIENVFY